MSRVTTPEQLKAIYGEPLEASVVKETDHVTGHYRRYIEASPFVILATSGPEGLDCSPRGDRAGFVRVENPKTLMLPDRHGNNRVDSLQNIVRDPRVGLLFLIPGSGNTLRVNGSAYLTADETLLASFAVEDKKPRSVIVVAVQAVYVQCARAFLRSDLWDGAKHIDPKSLPTAGEILAELSAERIGGKAYDAAWPERARKTLW